MSQPPLAPSRPENDRAIPDAGRADRFIALVKRDGQWRVAAQRQTTASPTP